MPSSFDPASTIPTRHWHALDDGRIQCDVCPRACKLRDGQRGTCYVRGRLGDELVLASYGRSSGYCVDPIEKKPLNHFLPGSPVLSFGTAGCNLTCRFCQNWDISKSKQDDTLAASAGPEAIALAAEQSGCRSVAFTYNDPTIFWEYAVDTAAACRERGIRSVAVTAGYMCPAPRAEFFSHIDAANVDLKSFDDHFYRHTCGAELGAVLDTLEFLAAGDVWLEITTLLIPGENDSTAELDAMTSWVVSNLGPEVPMHFTAFHPDYRMTDHERTPSATLRRAREIALGNGVHHAYTGNVHDPDGQSTRCPRCDRVVVRRDGYDIERYELDDVGRCRSCGEQLPGVYDGPAGTWGSHRQPVSIGRTWRRV
jgi:pyruvate formate lyase activating enzyme